MNQQFGKSNFEISRCAGSHNLQFALRSQAGTPGSSNRATADGSEWVTRLAARAAYAHASAADGLAPGRPLAVRTVAVGGPFATARAMRTVSDTRIVALHSTRFDIRESSRAVGGQHQ